jgi:poly-gamma-glutamate capsule biosynthesis protein CapA/YwtB (metallophosphatase superfamily)
LNGIIRVGTIATAALAFALLAAAPAAAHAAAPPAFGATEASETTPPPPAEDATVTLISVGDLMVHVGQLTSARTHGVYDFAPSFRQVASTISAADVAVGNLETTLRGSGFTGYPCFRSPKSYAAALKGAGFDVLTTANNHTFDGGAYGVRYTTDYLDRIHVAHTGSNGAGPAIVEHDGVKIAFLAYTYATNGIHSPFSGAVNRISLANMRKQIAAARTQADLVVVCPHWGTEYRSTPEAATHALAQDLIDAGADLILGSHPHVVRKVHSYKGHYIVYSMGNFISWMSKPLTDLGIMVQATITRRDGVTAVSSLKVLPVFRDTSHGQGTSTYRTVLISKALQPHASLISAADRSRMRSYLSYCKRMYGGLL